jgi:hypothetical protein
MDKKYIYIGGGVVLVLVLGYFLFRKKDSEINVIDTSSDESDNISSENSSNENNNNNSKKENSPKKENTPKKEVTPKNENSKKIDSLRAYIDKYALPKNINIKDYNGWNKIKKRSLYEGLDANNLDFLQRWADAVKLRISSKGKNGTMFSFRRKDSKITNLFNSYYGTFEFNAKNLNKRVFATEDTYAYMKPEESGYLTRIEIKKGKEIGVIKGVYFNINELRPYLYIPDTKFNPSLTNQMDFTNEYRWVVYGNNVAFK